MNDFKVGLDKQFKQIKHFEKLDGSIQGSRNLVKGLTFKKENARI